MDYDAAFREVGYFTVKVTSAKVRSKQCSGAILIKFIFLVKVFKIIHSFEKKIS